MDLKFLDQFIPLIIDYHLPIFDLTTIISTTLLFQLLKHLSILWDFQSITQTPFVGLSDHSMHFLCLTVRHGAVRSNFFSLFWDLPPILHTRRCSFRRQGVCNYEFASQMLKVGCYFQVFQSHLKFTGSCSWPNFWVIQPIFVIEWLHPNYFAFLVCNFFLICLVKFSSLSFANSFLISIQLHFIILVSNFGDLLVKHCILFPFILN